MPIQLVCSCGRHLHVADAHVGRRVQCPGCGVSHTVSDGQSAAASPGGSGRTFPAIVTAFLLVLLAGTAAGGLWFYFHGADDEDVEVADLSLVPGNAEGFVSVRLANLWQTPAARRVLEDLRQRDPNGLTPDARIERQTGLRPEQVDRSILVLLDPAERLGWLVVRTLEPYDRGKVLEKLQNVQNHRHGRRRYHTGTDADGMAVAVAPLSRHVLVIGSEEGVKFCLDRLAGPPQRGPDGPLSRVIDRCNGPHQVVAGLNVTEARREAARADAAGAFLADVQLAQATIDVGEVAMVEGRAQTEGAEQARKLHGELRGKLAALRLALTFMAFQGEEKARAAQQIGKLLDQLKFDIQGNELIATAEVDTAGISAAATVLPGLMGPMAPARGR